MTRFRQSHPLSRVFAETIENGPQVFNTSFERAHFRLQEKHKIVQITHSKQMLWVFKQPQ